MDAFPGQLIQHSGDIGSPTRVDRDLYVVWASGQIGYTIFVDETSTIGSSHGAVVYRKTTDGGTSWGAKISITQAGTTYPVSSFDVWFDQWYPEDVGTKIHIAYTNLRGSDEAPNGSRYIYLDTFDDSIGPSILVVEDPYAWQRDHQTRITKTVNDRLVIWENMHDSVSPYNTSLHTSEDDGATWYEWLEEENPIWMLEEPDIHFEALVGLCSAFDPAHPNDIWICASRVDDETYYPDALMQIRTMSLDTDPESRALNSDSGWEFHEDHEDQVHGYGPNLWPRMVVNPVDGRLYVGLSTGMSYGGSSPVFFYIWRFDPRDATRRTVLSVWDSISNVEYGFTAPQVDYCDIAFDLSTGNIYYYYQMGIDDWYMIKMVKIVDGMGLERADSDHWNIMPQTSAGNTYHAFIGPRFIALKGGNLTPMGVSWGVEGSRGVGWYNDHTSMPIVEDTEENYSGTSWTRRCELLIRETQHIITRPVTDLPVLIKKDNLPDEMLITGGPYAAHPTGRDIRFSFDPGGGQKLPFEIKKFVQAADPSDAKVEIWVRLPVIHKDQNTSFYVFYNSPTALAYADDDPFGAYNAWDPSIRFVGHVDFSVQDAIENSTRYSTQANMDELDKVGTITWGEDDSIIGDHAHISGAASSGFGFSTLHYFKYWPDPVYHINDGTRFNDKTISMWIDPDSWVDGDNILTHSTVATDHNRLRIVDNGAGNYVMEWLNAGGDGPHRSTLQLDLLPSPVLIGLGHQDVYNANHYTGYSWMFWANGYFTNKKQALAEWLGSNSINGELAIGYNANTGGNTLNSKIDEIRFETVTRSRDYWHLRDKTERGTTNPNFVIPLAPGAAVLTAEAHCALAISDIPFDLEAVLTPGAVDMLLNVADISGSGISIVHNLVGLTVDGALITSQIDFIFTILFNDVIMSLSIEDTDFDHDIVLQNTDFDATAFELTIPDTYFDTDIPMTMDTVACALTVPNSGFTYFAEMAGVVENMGLTNYFDVGETFWLVEVVDFLLDVEVNSILFAVQGNIVEQVDMGLTTAGHMGIPHKVAGTSDITLSNYIFMILSWEPTGQVDMALDTTLDSGSITQELSIIGDLDTVLFAEIEGELFVVSHPISGTVDMELSTVLISSIFVEPPYIDYRRGLRFGMHEGVAI